MGKNAPEAFNCTMNKKNSKFCGKNGLNLKLKHRKAQKTINFYLGDLVTRTGEQEIDAVSRRLLDNPGELACTS